MKTSVNQYTMIYVLKTTISMGTPHDDTRPIDSNSVLLLTFHVEIDNYRDPFTRYTLLTDRIIIKNLIGVPETEKNV